MYVSLAPDYGTDQFVVLAGRRNLQVDVFVAKVRSQMCPLSHQPANCGIATHAICILSQILPMTLSFASVITATPLQIL